MKLIWHIVSVPDPTNSNQKSAGTTWKDDRLMDSVVFQVGIANQFLTPQLFSKPTASNTLSVDSSYPAYDGDIVTIDTL